LEIQDNAKIYGEKMFGRTHSQSVDEDECERRISQQHKEVFDLYKRQRLAINPNKVVKLYPWQQQALEFIQNLSHREIVWIKGARGKEG